MTASSRGATMATTAVGVFVLAYVGLLGSTDHPLISTIWPAAGFSLVALLTHGYGVAPAIALAAWAANWAQGAPMGTAFALGFANAVGPLVAVIALRRLDFDRRLSSPRHGALLIACGAVIGPAVSATLGVAAISVTDGLAVQRWLTWWTGDALGVLAFAPWFLQYYDEPRRLRRAFTVEGFAAVVLMATATAASVLLSTRLSWLLFPIVGWRAIRKGTAGSATAVAVAGVVGTAAVIWSNSSDAFVTARALEFSQSLLLGLSVSAILLATFWQQHLDALSAQGRLKRLRVIAEELAGTGSWEWDTDSGRLTWSKGLLEIYGVRDGDFSGTVEDYARRLHPDNRGAVLALLQSAVARGDGFRSEERIIRDSDGAVRVLESFGRSQRGKDGRTILVGACLDITDRRAQELQLRSTLSHLRALIDASPLALLEMDAASTVLAWNASAERLFGWRAHEIIGMANPLIPPWERAVFDDALQRAFLGETVVIGAQRRLTKAGAELIARVSLAPVKDAAGVVGSVVGILEDVTARERLESALRQSESELNDLIHSAPIGIFRKTPDGELLMANQALVDLLGYGAPEELLAPRKREMLYDDPAERARLLAAFAAGADSLAAVVSLRRRDGTTVRVQWDARAVRDADGHVRYLECFVRDLTDRIQAEHGLRDSRDQLAHLSRRIIGAQEAERQSIARGLHDEIGQTLTAIRLNLQALQGRLGLDPAPPELEDALATLELASRSVIDLSLDIRPSVLDDIGLEAALRWYLTRSGERASLEVHVSSTLGECRLDPAVEVCCYRIAQEAMTNVVRHAAARRVVVKLTREGTTLRLQMQDDGMGFDVSAVSRGAYGTRLGFIGMAERAALVGGRMDVTSTQKGTVITATLPLEPPLPGTPNSSLGEHR